MAPKKEIGNSKHGIGCDKENSRVLLSILFNRQHNSYISYDFSDVDQILTTVQERTVNLKGLGLTLLWGPTYFIKQIAI